MSLLLLSSIAIVVLGIGLVIALIALTLSMRREAWRGH